MQVRISKIMSERNICSRREADEWIAKGWVKVDGQIVRELGSKANFDCIIEISNLAKKEQSDLITIILNKPIGYVSSQPEPGYTPAIKLIISENQWLGKNEKKTKNLQAQYFKGLAVSGRLDIDSQGLLLFTQDGRLAKKIIQKDSDIEKEYLVRYQGVLTEEKLKLLKFGLSLDDKPLKRAFVEVLNKDQLKIILKEGRKRQIRRMLDAVELKVIGLKRVRIGKLMLGSLPEGQWRFLDPSEKII